MGGATVLYVETVTEETVAQLEDIKKTNGVREVFLLFPLGSQYDQLILTALDRLEVYTIVANPNTFGIKDVRAIERLVAIRGLILSGGRASVYKEKVPLSRGLFSLGIPVLGICLGFQLWAQYSGIRVEKGRHGEFGWCDLSVLGGQLLDGVASPTKVLMNHEDVVCYDAKLEVIGATSQTLAAVAKHKTSPFYGVQFHPEVSEAGDIIFRNFCFGICAATDRYSQPSIVTEKINGVRERVGDQRVVVALSGGVDSATVTYLLHRALLGRAREQVLAYYISGLDRIGDREHVDHYFGGQVLCNLLMVDAEERFLTALRGITDSEGKRVAIARVYREILEEKIEAFDARLLAQGTLYTDRAEHGRGLIGGRKTHLKSHQNVAAFEDSAHIVTEGKISLVTTSGHRYELLEPLADLHKDGARSLCCGLGVLPAIMKRHPFPGTGLATRIEGEVTPGKFLMARAVDATYMRMLAEYGLYERLWQAGAVITRSEHTTIKGDDGGRGVVVCYFAVTSEHGLVTEPADLPYAFRRHFAERVLNEVAGVGAVCYRDSGKPPSTIEWE